MALLLLGMTKVVMLNDAVPSYDNFVAYDLDQLTGLKAVA